MMVGETLSYWLSRILEEKGKDAAIIAMGDFNDTPFNRSLTEYALSTISKNKVLYGRNPYLYNLMWPLMGERRASYMFDSEPLMIDQFLVSKGIAKKSGNFKIDESVVRIEEFAGMTSGRYIAPVSLAGHPRKAATTPTVSAIICLYLLC